MGQEKHKVIRWSYEHPHTAGLAQPDGPHSISPAAVAHTINTHPDVRKAKDEGYHQYHTFGRTSLNKSDIDDMVEEHKKHYQSLYNKDPEMAK